MEVARFASDLGAAGVRPRDTVLVPTMGALHAGHARLIERGVEAARERGLGGGCVVSIFVNPTQFNDAADLARYPRTLEADLAACEAAGAAVVFAPDATDVYPPDVEVPWPALPEAAVDRGLEDAGRPGHFAGVCRVVRRLFDLVAPAAAVFGEKDWQQLAVVRAMVARDGLGVEIIAGETVRDPDGLALSSRNRHLPAEDRPRALALVASLRAAQGHGEASAAEGAMREVLGEAGIAEPAYAVVRDAETLGGVRPGRPGRALVAASVGGVRLLDNLPWPGGVG